MQTLRDGWQLVRETPFHTLTRKEIIEENSMPKLDARMEPLVKWLKVIGEVYQELEPQKCAALRERVSYIAEKKKNVFLNPLDDEPEIFLFGVFFGAHGTVFLRDQTLLFSANQLCEKVKCLELQSEANESDKKIAQTVREIAFLYEKFIQKMDLNDS